MIRFSEKETCKLVELYRQYECLWNPNCDQYRNRAMKQAACETIARLMNLEDFTAIDVKSKLKNLRGTYNLERQKIKRIRESGKAYETNMKWYSIMESFIENVKNPPPPGENSSSDNTGHLPEGIYTDDSQWEQSGSIVSVNVSSAPSMISESEIEQSIQSISEPEIITITPEMQTAHSVPNSDVYTVVPEIQSGQPVSQPQVNTVTPEILTVKAVSNSEPISVTSAIKSDKSILNSGVTTVQSGIHTLKSISNSGVTSVQSGIQTAKSSTSNQTLYALIPEVQTSKSVSSPNYVAINSGNQPNVRYAGGCQVFTLAPEIQQRAQQVSADKSLGSRKRRHEEVTSTDSNNEIHLINKTRSFGDDFNDRSEDEMDAFGHFVAVNLRKLSISSALSAQTEILSVLTRYRLSETPTNQPPKQIVPYILTNGNLARQNPVKLQKLKVLN